MIQRLHPKRYTGKIQTAILDWSGTTADKYVIAPSIAFVEIFKKQGIDISVQETRAPMGKRKDVHIQEILNNPNVMERWIKAKGNPPTKQDLNKMYHDFIPCQLECLPKYTQLLEGTVEAANKLKQQGVQIGVTTGFNQAMSQILLKDAKEQGFEPDSCVSGDEVEDSLGSRPLPFMLYKNLANLRTSPIQSVVKVDDTESGIGEGLNAGCWTVGVYKYSNYTDVDSLEQWEQMSMQEKEERIQKSKQKLTDAGAHYVIESIKYLPEVIEDINKRLEAGESP